MDLRDVVINGFLILLVLFPATTTGQDSYALPAVVITELKRLDETYRVLDTVSEKVWPGWKDYRQVPFLLEYENGLRVLIGHPNPPKEFQLVNGFRVGDNQVFADRTQLVAKELIPPLAAGGGPVGFGSTADGLSVEVVKMNFAPADQLDLGDGSPPPPSAEQQILTYIHELFHCFQNSHLNKRAYGNLQFNADSDYALYSEIEGLALHRAYTEPDRDKAKLLIKEFLVARALKRAASMSEVQANQEASGEFAEGTATYAELRTLEALKSGGFTPVLTTQQDPYYSGFRNADPFLRRYPDRLLKAAADVEWPAGKSYTYGCFQALLSDRLFPGWQQSVVAGALFIDKDLGKRLAITTEEKNQIERRIRETYPVAEIRERNAKYLNARDDTYRRMKSRAGQVYVLDFKATGQYLYTVADKKGSYSLGYIQLYPDGLGPIKFDEVELSRITGPAEINQLYYVRTMDSVVRKGTKPFTVEGMKQADGSWKNAVVRTPLFTLKAPRVRIKAIGNLVKIQVLSRVI
jgi:hypothetical protein